MRTVRRQEGASLRRIVLAMLTDSHVISRIASKWPREGLFDSRHANLVGLWATQHFIRHHRPLGEHVDIVYEAWATRRAPDDEFAQSVAEFLRVLWADQDRNELPQSEYVLELAAKFFNRVKLQRQLSLVENAASQDKLDDAYQMCHNLLPVDFGLGSTIKPGEDESVWEAAFHQAAEPPLFCYPTTLGERINQAMVRDGFIAVMASDKMGKSLFLLDAAVRALLERRNVAYFECGDNGEAETILRLGCRVAESPRRQQEVLWPRAGEVWSLGVPPRDNILRGPLTGSAAYSTFRAKIQQGDLLRLSCHLNDSISVDGIEAILEQWEREGWVADLCCIDYADILAPPSGVKDPLEQIDRTWQRMRRIAQRWHCLVITATQANAEAYRMGGPLRRRNFGGRKTKLAHVTGMLGLSREQEDQDNGVLRIGWVVGRSWKWREGQTVSVAGCWEACCPILVPEIFEAEQPR